MGNQSAQRSEASDVIPMFPTLVSGGRADTRWCLTVTIELTGRSPIFAAIALAVRP